MFQICGDVEPVGFSVQNVYKMTNGDENATFEPLNLWTRERLRNEVSEINVRIICCYCFTSILRNDICHFSKTYLNLSPSSEKGEQDF